MPHVDQFYKYEPLQWYPHMGPKDAELWNKFIIANPGKFTGVIYDMRCGEIEAPRPDLPIRIRDAWNDLCRWRIDVVAENNEAIYTIEVRPRALADALGNARGYAVLYEREHKPTKRVIPLVITDIILPNTAIVAQARNIEIWTPTIN